MENEVNVKFNLNEAQVLLQLLDIAVRAHGLNAAEAGVILSKKIQQEFQAAGGDSSILNPNATTSGEAGSGPSGPESNEVTFSGPAAVGGSGPSGPSAC